MPGPNPWFGLAKIWGYTDDPNMVAMAT